MGMLDDFLFGGGFTTTVGYLFGGGFTTAVGFLFRGGFTTAAVDDDRGSAGQVLFSLLDPEDLFIIEPSSGIVRTKRTIPRGRLGTYRVQVKARDSPEALSNFHETQADAVINVVRPPHRVERIEHRKYLDSESNLKDDSGGSDVWFHVVDPRTGGIISRNDPGWTATSSLLYFVNGNLGISAQSVGPPIAELESSRPVVLAKTDDGKDGMQAALIALAILIFALSVFGVFYICCLYRRYQDAKVSL
ncbi:unnamed protein product [Cyprideis torosa]|uniref:Uncharacterized protein n=1 Tax=Cyprideis torosa TaxID=163714 RepID=A0A7R8WFQ7_9CRUS|nr:unnamed protein product [Cyprideis torosa]CAG0897314.1 unnamed protein product [Cyprideis torosa]